MNLIDLDTYRRQAQGELTPQSLLESFAELPFTVKEMVIVFTFDFEGETRLAVAHTAMNEADLVYMLERAKHEVLMGD